MLRRGSEEGSEGAFGWGFGTHGILQRKIRRGAFGVTFGTRGTLRRVPKKVSKGLSGWLSGHVACSEGKSEGVSRLGHSEGFRRGSAGGRSWSLDQRSTARRDLLVRTGRTIG